MVNIPTKNTGDQLSAAEFNQLPDELENAVLDSGQSISAANVTQVSRAMANYVGSAAYYQDSGAANAYVLSPVGSLKPPTSYTDGMEVRFRAANSNTSGSTVNVAGLGVKNIKRPNITDNLNGGEIVTNSDTFIRYDANADVFVLNFIERFIGFGFIQQNQDISGGAIDWLGAYMGTDTEGGVPVDDLETINGGQEGDILRLRSTSSSRKVIIKTDVGNIKTCNRQDVRLDSSADFIDFVSSAGLWLETNRCVFAERIQKAQAWVSWDGTGPLTLLGTYNVSSVTDLGTGAYRINFVLPFAGIGYCVSSGGTINISDSTPGITTIAAQERATSSVTIRTSDSSSGSLADFEYVAVQIFGSLQT